MRLPLVTLGSLLLLLLLPVFATAQTSPDWRYVNLRDLDFATASQDNLFAPLVNPSLLATDGANGLGWSDVWMDGKMKAHYWLFANLDGLSYVYEYNRDIHNKSFNNHTLALGSELFPAHILPNLYAGTGYSWTNNKFRKGAFRTALTYRPHDSASLALRLDNPYQGAPAYHAGLALRPLAFVPRIADYRLELSADLDYSKDEAGDYGFRAPVLGINTQVLDGLNIGATYNLDTETAMLNFGIGSGKTALGSLASAKKGQQTYALPYVHLADEAFKPFFGSKSQKWYDMKLKGNIVTYEAPKYSFGQINFYESDSRSIEDIIRDLKTAKDDSNIQGILLKNPSFSTSLALMQELVAAVQDFKSSGKKVAAYYDNIGNAGYIFAASVADLIYLNPQGSIDLRGLSVTSPYFHDLLDAIGVDVLNFRSHRYKSAGNMLSESEMTDAEREVYESMLQSDFDQLVALMQAGRGSKLKASVAETIDAGPYFQAQDALDAGLVDSLIYEDQLPKELKSACKFSATDTCLPDYRDYDWSKPREKLIAVIYTSGNIIMGKGTPGKNIGHETTVKQIRAARNNKDYKGIILRVDSGGGSGQASDIILHELQLAQTENKKPVVVSMAGMAASGGYYISCSADRIVADPATLTGSIGVIGLTLTVPRLMEKIKVNWSSVKKGAHADFGTPYRAWTDEEKLRMTSAIENFYEDFVSKVDKGRPNLSLEDVHALAQGRVWTGEQAKANGLIDDLGGLDTALEHMREITGIKGKIRLVDATTKPNAMTFRMNSDPLGSLPGLDALQTIGADYIKVYELWRDFHNDKALMLCPLGADSIEF